MTEFKELSLNLSMCYSMTGDGVVISLLRRIVAELWRNQKEIGQSVGP
jgi:hypothetical protein